MIIAGAGGAAHLPGMVASLTPLPVIGVPVTPKGSHLDGLDALMSIVQVHTPSYQCYALCPYPIAAVSPSRQLTACRFAGQILFRLMVTASSDLHLLSCIGTKGISHLCF